MKLILVTATLFLSVTLADLISNESGQTLKCFSNQIESNGWKIFDGRNLEDLEKENCSSRCYAAASK